MLKILLLLYLPLTTFAAVNPFNLDEARSHFASQRNEQAKIAFTALAAAEPHNAEFERTLGLIAMRESRFDDALSRLERAATLDPALQRESNYHAELGDIYGLQAMHAGLFSRLGFAKKCRAAYERAVELDPSNIRARWCLMEYYRQAPGLVGGSKEKAHAQADAIHALDPATGRHAVALVLVSQKRFDEAFSLFSGVNLENSTDYTALHQLGQLSVATGKQIDTGLAALRRCLALPAVSQQPTHAQIHYFIAKLHERIGDTAAARAAYQAALNLDPTFQPALIALKSG